MKQVHITTSTIHDGDMKGKNGKATNLSNFVQKLGYTKEPVVLHQTHSDVIREIPHSNPAENMTGDGMVTDSDSLSLGIFTADCLPIVFFDPKKERLGLIHAGYKGILKSIHQKMLQKFLQKDSNIEDIKVHIGPSIGGCCYDIEETRFKEFKKCFKHSITHASEDKNGKKYLSLSRLVRHDLCRSGVKEKNIIVSKDCTCCSNNYFSFRRHNSIKGLNLTVAKIVS